MRSSTSTRSRATCSASRESESVGRNIAEFLHPDDLIRALRVVGMMVDRALDVPVTPAVYRLRRHDGTWCPVEINASMLPGPDGDDPGAGMVVIVGRYSGDRDLQDQIMEQLTSGRDPVDMISLIPEFGHWRHPNDHYAVCFTGDDGVATSAGSPLACKLAAIDVAGTPVAAGGRVRRGDHGHARLAARGGAPAGAGRRAGRVLGRAGRRPPVRGAVHDHRLGSRRRVRHGGPPLRHGDHGAAAHPDPPVASAGHVPAPGGSSRSAHRADQPVGLPRGARGGGRQLQPSPHGRALHRPRRLQGRQRRPRPPGR